MRTVTLYELSIVARGLNFGLKFLLRSCFVCASGECSVEIVWMRRLVLASAAYPKSGVLALRVP